MSITVFQNAGALMVKNLRPGLTEVGKIKIGRKGKVRTSSKGNEFQPPEKLDHFLITTLERGPDNNLLRDEQMHAQFGDKPTSLPVRLLFNDPWLSFQTVYTAYRGGKRFCTGDGERAMRLENGGKPTERQCPCPLLDMGYEGSDKCKINGTLSVVIEGAKVVGGVWKLRTTSINTCQGIASSLALLTAASGGQISGIPLALTVRPKATTTPQGQQTTVYIVGIEYRGSMGELRELAYREALADATHGQRIQRVEEQARLLLAAPAVDDDEEEDIRDEFYPAAAAEAYGAVKPATPATNGHSIKARLLAQAEGRELDATAEANGGSDTLEHDAETGEVFEVRDATGKVGGAYDSLAAAIDGLGTVSRALPEGELGPTMEHNRALLTKAMDDPSVAADMRRWASDQVDWLMAGE